MFHDGCPMTDISFQTRLERLQATWPERHARLAPLTAAAWLDGRPRKPGALADLLAWGLLVWAVAFTLKLHLMLHLTGTAYAEALRDIGRHGPVGATLTWLMEPGPVSLMLVDLLLQ